MLPFNRSQNPFAFALSHTHCVCTANEKKFSMIAKAVQIFFLFRFVSVSGNTVGMQYTAIFKSAFVKPIYRKIHRHTANLFFFRTQSFFRLLCYFDYFNIEIPPNYAWNLYLCLKCYSSISHPVTVKRELNTTLHFKHYDYIALLPFAILALTKFVCNQCVYWVRNKCYTNLAPKCLDVRNVRLKHVSCYGIRV